MAYFQYWDSVTPPSIPADWTATSGFATAADAAAVSAPNILSLTATAAPTNVATYSVQDGFGGDTTAYTFLRFGGTSTCWGGVFGRGSSYPVVYNSSSYLLAKVTSNQPPIPTGGSTLVVQFIRYNSGTATTLATLSTSSASGGGFTVNDWYQLSLALSGSSYSITFFDSTSGLYLQPGGSYASTPAACLAGTDPSPILGQGYWGIQGYKSSFDSLSFDNFSLGVSPPAPGIFRLTPIYAVADEGPTLSAIPASLPSVARISSVPVVPVVFSSEEDKNVLTFELAYLRLAIDNSPQPIVVPAPPLPLSIDVEDPLESLYNSPFSVHFPLPWPTTTIGPSTFSILSFNAVDSGLPEASYLHFPYDTGRAPSPPPPPSPTPSPTPTPTPPAILSAIPCNNQDVSNVNLHFFGKQCGGGPSSSQLDYLSQTGAVGGGNPTVFHDTAIAYFSSPSDANPFNKSQLDALSSTFNNDYFSWIRSSQDTSFVGICAVPPVPLYDQVIFDYYEGEGMCRTRLVTAPFMDIRAIELGHYDADSDCKTKYYAYPSCVYMYGPPKQSVSGQNCLGLYLVCLEDGRLDWTYLSDDCGKEYCSISICVNGCDNKPLAGVTVTVTGPGGFTATATTGSTGCTGIAIPAFGSYTVTLTKAGYKTTTQTINVKQCNQVFSFLMVPNTANPCVQFYVYGCCGIGLPGATINISGPGGSANLTTDGNGFATWCIPQPGTYTYTISHSCHFISQSGTLSYTISQLCSFFPLQDVSVTLIPISGYICGFNGPYPTPPTLQLTDSVFGGATLTYDPVTNVYIGSISGCQYPEQPCTLVQIGAYKYSFGCPQSPGFTITYVLQRLVNSCAATIYASYNLAFCGECTPQIPGAWNGLLVPSDTFSGWPCTGPFGLCEIVSLNPWCNPTCYSSVSCNSFYLSVNPYRNCENPDVLKGPSCPLDMTCISSDGSEVGNPCSDFRGSGVIAPGSACPCAAWVQFHGGTITITE